MYSAKNSLAQRVCSVDARVVAREPICREHVALTVELAGFPPSTPGQFLMLRCADAPQSKSAQHGISVAPGGVLLRRPFSIATRTETVTGETRLLMILRVVGQGTRWLADRQPGDALSLTGPLGRGFEFPPPDTPVVLVGGGVGIPPLLYAADALLQQGTTHVVAVFGATCADLLPLRLHETPVTQPAAHACVTLPTGRPLSAVIATDDGSVGVRGRVPDVLARCLDRLGSEWQSAMMMTCGPEPMLVAVARMARARAMRLEDGRAGRGLGCQVCLERFMACGVGCCLSCVVRTVAPDEPGGWRWSLACRDGPVFDAGDLWDYAGDA